MSRWRLETSAGSAQHEIYSRLSLDKAEPGHSGLYECEVAALEQANSAGAGNAHLPDNLAAGNQAHLVLSGDKLRRVFGLLVNGKYKSVGSVLAFPFISGRSLEQTRRRCLLQVQSRAYLEAIFIATLARLTVELASASKAYRLCWSVNRSVGSIGWMFYQSQL